MNLNESYFGLKIASEEIKASLAKVQAENKISNDMMCIILRDVQASYESARSMDYALCIRALARNNETLKKELERVQNDKPDD